MTTDASALVPKDIIWNGTDGALPVLLPKLTRHLKTQVGKRFEALVVDGTVTGALRQRP